MCKWRDSAFVRMIQGVGLEIVGLVKSLVRHWIICVVLLGFFLMAVPELDWTKGLQQTWAPEMPWLLKKFESLGYLIVGGVFFAVIAKGRVFLDIFKSVVQDESFQVSVRTSLKEVAYVTETRKMIREEMESVVLGEDFITQAKWAAWERLARVLFETKLPGIHDEVQKKISDDFFPQEKSYYLLNYWVDIRIELRDDGRIQIRDEVRFEVQPGPSAEVPCRYCCEHPNDVKDFELLVLEVDRKNRLGEFQRNTMSYDFPLPGGKISQIRRKTSRIRPFVHSIEGPSHSIRFNRFVKGFDVTIHHSPKLSVFLTERGTKSKLEPGQAEEALGLQSLRRYYNGVLLPNWGLQITWTLKPEGEP